MHYTPSGTPPISEQSSSLRSRSRRTSTDSLRSSASTSSALDSESDDCIPDTRQEPTSEYTVSVTPRRRPRSSEFTPTLHSSSPSSYATGPAARPSYVSSSSSSFRQSRKSASDELPELELGTKLPDSHANAFSAKHNRRSVDFKGGSVRVGSVRSDGEGERDTVLFSPAKSLVRRISSKALWKTSRQVPKLNRSSSDAVPALYGIPQAGQVSIDSTIPESPLVARAESSSPSMSTTTSASSISSLSASSSSTAATPQATSSPRVANGTLHQLISSLILKSQDIGDIRQFILAKNSFTTSLELLSYLVITFQQPPNNYNNNDEEHVSSSAPASPSSSPSESASSSRLFSRTSVVLPRSSSSPLSSSSSSSSEHSQIQIRIINFLKKWLTTSPKDFDQKSVSSQFHLFLDELSQIPEMAPWAKLLESTYKLARSSYSAMRKVIKGKTEHDEAPPTLLSHPLIKLETAFASNPRIWRSVDPEELPVEEFARQWTLVDHIRFTKIRISELEMKRWENAAESPHVALINNHFNRGTRWVASEILKHDSPKRRAKTITFMISVADHLLSMKNFFGTMVIVVGLSQVPISRLTSSWDKLSSSSEEKWKSLGMLSNPAHNFRMLRTLQEMAATSQEPFILSTVLLFRDLFFISEGNEDWFDQKQQLINWDKLKLQGRTLEAVFLSQTTPYIFKHIPVLKKFLTHLPNMEEGELMNRSKALEPQRD